MVVGDISSYLITIFVAWFGTHIIKYVIALIKNEKRGFRSHLFISGGMPSSHSATVVSVAVIIALRDGIESGLFGLAVLVALIVMYDAVKVRRSSGEQGLALRQLIREQKSDIKLPRAAQGHTPVEVIVGAFVGALFGLVVFLAT
ncbi:MAG TPA: divergent PAP2 family protein [Candidatus Saccharimonadales bacterium]|nr:divergent PAP2 family protein [Candidatus Saccharimonadales bacterium]